MGALLLLCAIASVFVAPTVWRAAREGRTALVEGARAVLRRDGAAARVEFRAARDLFEGAQSRLASPLSWPLRITPVARTHVGVASSLSSIGSRVARSGIAISDTMGDLPEQSLAFREGRVDLHQVRRARAALEIGAAGSAEIEEAIERMPSGWVGGPLTAPRRQAQDELPSILDGVRKAEAALGGLPGILAEGGRKRYLVAFSNLSELRGSGGLFGFVTVLAARDGDLDLEDFAGRPTEVFGDPADVDLDYPEWFPDDLRTQAGIFQNINMTTDFPTVGRFVVQTAETEAGDLDGVMAVDPLGVGAILSLTGPISVATWPAQITADNVAKIAMHDVYLEIPNSAQRELFFEQLVRTAFAKLTSSTIRLSAASAGAFDRAVRGGHFRLYSEHEADQAVFHRLGASGTVDRASTATDVLSVVSENASGSKIDWFLRREIRYRVALDPDAGAAATALSVTFRNTAPATGLPDYIIGSAVPGLPRGDSRQFLILVRSPPDTDASLTVDGRPGTLVAAREGPLAAYRSTIDVPARGRSELRMRSAVPWAFVDGGLGERDGRVYRLHVLRQAVASPDFADIEISVPAGWRTVGRARFLGDLTQDVVLEVRVERTTAGSLFGEPLSFVRRLLGRVF